MPTVLPRRPYLNARFAMPPADTSASDYVFSVPKCRCPVCSDMLVQKSRGRIDRLLSVFVPVRRFSCSNSLCGWEGILRHTG